MVKKLAQIGALALISVSIFCCYAYSASTEEDALKKGIEYSRQGDNDGAIAEFSKVIAINPYSVDSYYNRGLAFYKMGSFDEAIADYNKVLEISPKSSDALYGRGLAYFKKNDIKQAISDYDKVIEMRPDFPLAYSARAIAYFSKKNYVKTLSDRNKAIALGFRLRPLKETATESFTVIAPGKGDSYLPSEKAPGTSQTWKVRRRSERFPIVILSSASPKSFDVISSTIIHSFRN